MTYAIKCFSLLYFLLNIYQAKLVTTSGASKFNLIVSSFTFYHLVDPIGTLSSCYELQSDQGGIAIIRQFPFHACIRSNLNSDVNNEKELVLQLNTFWRNEGFNAVIIPTLDSPGNCMIVMKRQLSSPNILTFPYSYTGDLTSTTSDQLTYRHAIHDIQIQRSLLNDLSTNNYNKSLENAIQECIKLLDVPIYLKTTNTSSSTNSGRYNQQCLIF